MPSPILLLTRPRASSEAFAEKIVGMADVPVEVAIAPLIEIVPLGELPDLGPFASVIVSSGHAVSRCGDALSGRRVFAVGETTARLAEAAGADATCLGRNAAQFLERMDEVATPAIYLHGRYVTTDLAKEARLRGMVVEGRAIYDQRSVAMDPGWKDALAGDRIIVAPVFSRRSARLLRDAVSGTDAAFRFVAISRDVGAILADLGEVTVADAPDADAMQRATFDELGLSGLAGTGDALRL